jgi:hypothetical protein
MSCGSTIYGARSRLHGIACPPVLLMRTHCSANSVTERRSGRRKTSFATAIARSSTDLYRPRFLEISGSILGVSAAGFDESGNKSNTGILYRVIDETLYEAELSFGHVLPTT